MSTRFSFFKDRVAKLQLWLQGGNFAALKTSVQVACSPQRQTQIYETEADDAGVCSPTVAGTGQTDPIDTLLLFVPQGAGAGEWRAGCSPWSLT